MKTDENLEFWIQYYIHECHNSLFGTWDFKSIQNLKFSEFYIWTYSSWSNRKFEKLIWSMILFYHIYIKWYVYISFIWEKGFTHPTGCCGYRKRDLKILTYNEIENNILFISYMLDAQEEQYSENNLHIQPDVVSIIKGI